MPARASYLSGLAALCLLAAGAAQAADPVAIVEDVSANAADLQPMDYVAAGRIIALAANQTLTLGYMKSCTREVIAGGRVTIGQDQSVVVGGKVERSQVRCDGGRLRLTAEQASKSGGMVFRKPPLPAVNVDMVVYGRGPVLELAVGEGVAIERLDAAAPILFLKPKDSQLMRGRFFDLARENHLLEAGGVYRVSSSGRQIVIRVDPSAEGGPSPVVGRLLRF